MHWVNGDCAPLCPQDFLKTNTVMEVIHQAGMRPAWTDKHPAHEIVSGPSGQGLDELHAPEFNDIIIQPSAGTILRALGLNPKPLDAVKREGTTELPGLRR